MLSDLKVKTKGTSTSTPVARTISKNRNKRKYFQNNFAQSEKNHVKRKYLEKMNQLKKHILFFDFLENHYVSKDEVSKQHLNVIKKSNL